MIKLNTLDAIIDDIMLTIRNNNIAESEQLSRIQIEQWIIRYRAILIKQDIDKGRDINPRYIQDLPNLALEMISSAYTEFPDDPVSESMLVTVDQIPDTIDFHFKSGIVQISDVVGNEIQLMSEKRSNLQKYRKYTFYSYSAFMKSKKIYINGPGDIKAISVRGIFENPADVAGFNILSDAYPIPENMLPVLKDLIITKELKLQFPSDTTNNGEDNTLNATARK